MGQHSRAQTKIYHIKNLDDSDIKFTIDKCESFLSVAVKSDYKRSFDKLVIPAGICLLMFCFTTLFCQSSAASATLSAISVFIFVFHLLTTVSEESMIVSKSLGYQLTTKFIVGETSKFIPWNKVQNVIINEVILRNKVIFLLTLVCTSGSNEEIVPIFLNSKLGLDCIKKIYRDLYSLART